METKILSNKILLGNYSNIKRNLDSLIKKCHDLLYSKGGSIVGSKAQNDIMRILCLKLLQSQFNDETSPLYKKCLEVKEKNYITDIKYELYMSYCKDLKQLIVKADDIMRNWKFFVNKFLIHVFPSIYFESDDKFNCDNYDCICELIRTIYDNLIITDEFKDAFSTTCGDIHENFRAYSGGKGAKELGQYFTPRHLIHLIFYGIGLEKDLNHSEQKTIYDPCMGTGGFLTRLFKLCNISSNNIYGCETEMDTIKFGNMSMILTTGKIDMIDNIKKCDSLCENPFIVDKKFSAIITNPPFGTKMKYDELKKKFEENIKDIKFEDVYPIKTNNGACLFIQHCIYMLEKNGVCAIVLPDGELFEGNSKWSKEFRKWWANTANIKTILKVPSGTFEHAGVKTNVVVFTKNGSTQNIQFIETTKECNIIKDMLSISMDELQITNYSLDVREYIKQDIVLYDVPMISLGEVCEFQNSGEVINKSYWNKGNNILYSCNKTNMMCNYTIFPEEKIAIEGDLLISRNGNPYIHYITKPSIYTNVVQRLKIKKEYNVKYIYYYIITILEDIKKKSNGQGIPSFNMDIWNKIKIPLPSLENQKKIMEELEILETSIQTLETRLKQLNIEKEQCKKYSKKAEIRDLLKDSNEVALRDVFEKIISGKFNSKDSNSVGKYPFYTNKANNPDGFCDNYCFDYEKYFILIKDGGSGNNKYGENIGLGKIFKVYGKSGGTSHQYALVPKKDCNFEYLYYYLRFIKNYIMDLAHYTTGLGCIKKGDIEKIKIPIPSQEIQQKCIKLFEEKEAIIQVIDNKIEEEKKYIEQLKQLAKDIIVHYC